MVKIVWTTGMLDYLTPNVLVLLAGACYVLGFLIINQVILRLFILAGSTAYLGYYATVAQEPLWGAINITLMIMTANILGFIGLVGRNARFSIPRAHRDIYPSFAPLRPGEFRALVRLAERQVLPADLRVTTEGQPVNRLYYLIKGTSQVTKGVTSFPMPQGIFIGEVAYLSGNASAATTDLPQGAEVLIWDLDTLRRATARRPQLKLALDAVISRDLARKVALAVAPGIGTLQSANAAS